MLLLTTEDIEKIIDMKECISALEEVYRDLHAGQALISPRIDSYVPCGREDAHYTFKQMGGSWPRRKIQALRIGSDIIAYRKTEGVIRQDKLPLADGRYVGLVQLFNTETGELMAIFPDGLVQTYRVGATNGIATQYLARRDARVVGLIGAGFQARTQLQAVTAVRSIHRVNVFSLHKASREAFAREWREKLGIAIVPMETAEACVRDADIILSATSTLTPVIQRHWLRKGVHISCIKKQEISAELFPFFDRLVVHNRDHVKQIDLVLPGTPNVVSQQLKGWWTEKSTNWQSLVHLPELVSDRSLARQTDDETTCFINNIGLGLQFAAVGWVLLERARAQKIGQELPNGWFTQSIRS